MNAENLEPADTQRSSSGAPPPQAGAGTLRERVLLAAAARPAETRRTLARRTALLSVSSWLVGLGVFAYFGGIRATGRPWSLIAGCMLGMGVFAALAAWAALWRGRSTLGRTPILVLPVVLAVPLLMLAWKVFWSTAYEGFSAEWPTRPGFRCLALSLSIASCPLLAFAVARRHSDPRRPVLTGFVAGLAIGSVTSLLSDLWCPVAYFPHVLLGHFLPIVVLGGLGALLGRVLIAVKW